MLLPRDRERAIPCIADTLGTAIGCWGYVCAAPGLHRHQLGTLLAQGMATERRRILARLVSALSKRRADRRVALPLQVVDVIEPSPAAPHSDRDRIRHRR